MERECVVAPNRRRFDPCARSASADDPQSRPPPKPAFLRIAQTAARRPRKSAGWRQSGAGAPRSAPRDRPGERREARVSLIYGFHSVAAALKAPRRELIRLYATAAAAERLGAEIAARGLETRIMSPEEISARAPREAVHQGLLLEARPLAPIDIADLPANGLVLVLDQITDPHNVGAILRTAAAFAVDALVTTERHSPDFAGALAKSASGGLEHVPICSVTNLARALAEMGDMGYWRIGLDSEAPDPLTDETLSRPLALGPRRGGQGPATADARAMRSSGAPRSARRDQEPQRLERLRHRARARA